MRDAFDRLGYGAVVLARDGQVIDLTSSARRHVNSCIQINRGQLNAVDRNANEKLQSLIASHVRPGGQGAAVPNGAVVLPQPQGHPVIAYVAWNHNRAVKESSEAAGIVLLVDPDDQREPADVLLQQAFSLTPAELRLVLGLVKGLSLQAIAQQHGLSVGTLRVHLKSVFAKTGTRRQAQLLTLLDRLSMRLR
jgi:DNA-binding CsgD family transcriptional regulator